MSLYSIEEISQKLTIDISRLRFYEKTFRDHFSSNIFHIVGHKNFSEKDIDLFEYIYSLHEKQSASLIEIEKILAKNNNCLIFTVSSGKGGVGKTTVACNIAVALAKFMQKKVLLFDADLGLSNVHVHMGINPLFHIGHVIFENKPLKDVIMKTEYGVDIISSGSGIFELSNLNSSCHSKFADILNILKKQYDVIFLDAGAGISETVMNFVKLANHLLVVTTSDLAALTDAYALMKVTLQNNPNKNFSLLVNFVKTEDEAKGVYKRLNDCTLKFLNHEIKDFYWIRKDENILQSILSRKPIIAFHERSWIASQIKRIAEELLITVSRN